MHILKVNSQCVTIIMRIYLSHCSGDNSSYFQWIDFLFACHQWFNMLLSAIAHISGNSEQYDFFCINIPLSTKVKINEKEKNIETCIEFRKEVMRENEQLLLLYIGMYNKTAVLRFRIYSSYITTLLVKSQFSSFRHMLRTFVLLASKDF